MSNFPQLGDDDKNLGKIFFWREDMNKNDKIQRGTYLGKGFVWGDWGYEKTIS